MSNRLAFFRTMRGRGSACFRATSGVNATAMLLFGSTVSSISDSKGNTYALAVGPTTISGAVSGGSSHTYQYDANASQRNGFSLTWTSYNYPSVINGPNKTLSFSYGPDRQRFRQMYTNCSTTETTMYVGGMLEKGDGGRDRSINSA